MTQLASVVVTPAEEGAIVLDRVAGLRATAYRAHTLEFDVLG